MKTPSMRWYTHRDTVRCLALVGLAMAIGGCVSTTEVCNAILRASIQVDVVDAATNAPAAAGSTVVLQSSSWRDSVAAPIGPDSLLTAAVWHEDRAGPGDYAVTVYKPGYQAWTQSSIRIGSSGCHVSGPTRLTAMLRRATP